MLFLYHSVCEQSVFVIIWTCRLKSKCLVSKNLLPFTQATSAGSKDQEAINFLEKKMKNDPSFTYEETVQVTSPLC